MPITPNKETITKLLENFSFRDHTVPDYMHGGIAEYLCSGIPPGDFLMAVLANDCKEALRCADDVNLWLLPVYYAFFYNHAPAGAWGSKRKVLDWCNSFSE